MPLQSSAKNKTVTDQIVELIITEASFLAIMEAKKDEIFTLTKTALSKNLDLSDVSDDDLRMMLKISNHETVSAVVVGMRRAFRQRIESDFTEIDKDILLSCIKLTGCDAKMYTPSAVASLKGFAQFGKEQGAAIGQAVGNAITPKMIKLVEGPKRDQFENPDSVIKLLKSDILPKL